MHKRVPGEIEVRECWICHRRLTDTEIEYYENECEECVDIIMDGISHIYPVWLIKLRCRINRLLSIFKRRRYE